MATGRGAVDVTSSTGRSTIHELGLAGKVAIVTGGSEEFGLALAERFAREGVKVEWRRLSRTDAFFAQWQSAGYRRAHHPASRRFR